MEGLPCTRALLAPAGNARARRALPRAARRPFGAAPARGLDALAHACEVEELLTGLAHTFIQRRSCFASACLRNSSASTTGGGRSCCCTDARSVRAHAARGQKYPAELARAQAAQAQSRGVKRSGARKWRRCRERRAKMVANQAVGQLLQVPPQAAQAQALVPVRAARLRPGHRLPFLVEVFQER